jgi:hypothetical protein
MLSKSRYISGQQCDKLLWFKSINKPLPEKKDKGTEDRLKTGNEIGNLAKELFPGGVDIEYLPDNPEKMVEDTNLAIEKGAPIYEATFVIDNNLIRVDLMNQTNDGWDMYEVKSTSQKKLKPYHKEDASFQWYVLSQVEELKMNNAYVITINGDYLKDGRIDLEKLFTRHNITKEVNDHLAIVPNEINKMQGIIECDVEPNTPIGPHCSKPHSCEYKKLCWEDVKDNSVLNLYRMDAKDKFNLFDNEYKTFNEIPEGTKLSDIQQKQITSNLNNETFIDKNRVKEFIDTIKYPISYFDFETFQDAVPRFDNQRPYMQMPFQFSLHIQNEPLGKIDHREWIVDHKDDPRKEIAEKMLKWIPPKGTIIAYHKSFEMGCIKKLARYNVELSDQLLALNERFTDLKDPFSKGYYYHPAFNGSFSIKKVLPALYPNDSSLNYDSLNIKNGGEASLAYKKFHELNDEEIETYRNDLFAYCKVDTLAMVRILEKLIKKI